MTGIPWGELEPLQVQRLISALLVRTVPNAHAVDGAGGDDGADVVSTKVGGIHVYEDQELRLVPHPWPAAAG